MMCYSGSLRELKGAQGSLSKDLFEPRTATGSRMFPFWPDVMASKRSKRKKIDFRLPSVAQERLCLQAYSEKENPSVPECRTQDLPITSSDALRPLNRTNTAYC